MRLRALHGILTFMLDLHGFEMCAECRHVTNICTPENVMLFKYMGLLASPCSSLANKYGV
ncbi:hypothetical protein RHMOL_Rhmol08G0007800 [Rhododendron molle]|uniref:Uncharacterized protein n=1 Tax=Rhododendron molle TaxID=49168 RepID=A0ACC0MIM8_RHOML|nr:hypothetical protein RHMOL_Rhmol08G0007800 [Rhododendron molle]